MGTVNERVQGGGGGGRWLEKGMMLISPEEKEEVLKIFPKVKSPQCSSCGKVQDR